LVFKRHLLPFVSFLFTTLLYHNGIETPIEESDEEDMSDIADACEADASDKLHDGPSAVGFGNTT
jgi:hypothetical protein